MSTLYSRRAFLAGLGLTGVSLVLPADTADAATPPGFLLDLPPCLATQDATLTFACDASLPFGPYTADFRLYDAHKRQLYASGKTAIVDAAAGVIRLTIPVHIFQHYPAARWTGATYRLALIDHHHVHSPLLWGAFPLI